MRPGWLRQLSRLTEKAEADSPDHYCRCYRIDRATLGLPPDPAYRYPWF